MRLLGFDDGFHRLFDAEVDHLVAVVGEDDVHQVFADVMHVTLHGGDQEFGLGVALPLHLVHQRLQLGDGRLHGFGALQHEGQLHLPGAEQLADHLHAIEQEGVDDLQGFVALQRDGQSCIQANALPINDVLLQALFDRQLIQGGA